MLLGNHKSHQSIIISWYCLSSKFDKIKNKQMRLRLTKDNCSPLCSGGSGSRKFQSAQTPLCNFIPPHFASPSLASQTLIRAATTISYLKR